jgi:hypothetical protein
VAVALKGPSAAQQSERKAVEMPGLWKAWKAKGRLPPLSTSPLGISPKAGEIPTFPQLSTTRADGKVENQRQVFHFPTASVPIPENQNTSRGRAIARAAALRAASTNDVYQFGNIPF